MEGIYLISTFWLFLAVLSTVLAKHLRVSSALIEICVGTVAAAIFESKFGAGSMGAGQEWLKFLASIGTVLLTFLSGAELEPQVLKAKWKEAGVVGIVGFLAPFLVCTSVARFVLHWDARASWLCGIALSDTSIAVVYAVMLETGFNQTDYGKGILAACFVNGLGTVITLGILFAPFTYKTLIFIVASVLTLLLLPFVTSKITAIYGYRTGAIRTKWVIFVLCGLGALSIRSGSEPVLPAYLVGMVLAGAARRDEHWVRRLRTLTIGFLTPFYFIRAGALVSLPALIVAPLIIALLLAGKVVSKIFGLYPVVSTFRSNIRERWYYTLMMSTGLTFGTISAIYGFSHGIVNQQQYSYLVAVVIASAVIPTLIATFIFIPHRQLVLVRRQLRIMQAKEERAEE